MNDRAHGCSKLSIVYFHRAREYTSYIDDAASL